MDEGLVPGVGAYGQDVINRQIRDIDIYVGMLGTRFGTATVKAGSGTEEEFTIQLDRYLADPTSVRILFYFKTSTDDIDSIDLEQLSKVRAFQDVLKSKGVLYANYPNQKEFEIMLSRHLATYLEQQWDDGACRWVHPDPLRSDAGRLPVVAESDSPVIEDIESGESEMEWLDYEDEFRIGADRVGDLMTQISGLMNEVTLLTKRHVESMLPSASTSAERRKILNEYAELLKRFAANLRIVVMQLKQAGPEALDYAIGFLRKVDVASSAENMSKNLLDLESFAETIQQSRLSIIEFHDSVQGARGHVAGWPRITSKMSSAKARICETLDELGAALVSMLNKYDILVERSTSLTHEMKAQLVE